MSKRKNMIIGKTNVYETIKKIKKYQAFNRENHKCHYFIKYEK